MILFTTAVDAPTWKTRADLVQRLVGRCTVMRMSLFAVNMVFVCVLTNACGPTAPVIRFAAPAVDANPASWGSNDRIVFGYLPRNSLGEQEADSVALCEVSSDGLGFRRIVLFRELGLPMQGAVWCPTANLVALSGHGVITLFDITSRTTVCLSAPSDPLLFTPAWNSSGDSLICAPVVSNNSGLYVFSRDHGLARRIPLPNAGNPSWSPTRDEVAANTRDGDVIILDLQTQRVREILSTRGMRSYAEPQFAPDGETLLLYQFHDDGPNVLSVKRDGSGLRTVLRGGLAPRWSPDGRHFVYIKYLLSGTSAEQVGNGKLWVASVDGTERRQLIP
jgi:hypothetical protein